MALNIDKLTIGDAKELATMFGQNKDSSGASLNSMIGKKVIIRTYSAGVWFGTLSEKSGKEVIITKARRMWRWWAKESISLSAVAIHGINQEKSKIAQAVDSVWLDAIEIIPCTSESIELIQGAKNAAAG